MNAPLFENEHIHMGSRIADGLLKRLRQEDPRPVVIALAMCLSLASRACGLKRMHVMDLLQTFEQSADGGVTDAVQAGLSSLYLP